MGTGISRPEKQTPASDRRLFRTASGKPLDLTGMLKALRNKNPDNWLSQNLGLIDFEEAISIADIATGLSNICRYTGQTRRFYSVAEHSVLVSRAVDPEHALKALLHDAHEAFVGDHNRPFLEAFPEMREIERHLQRAVFRKFTHTDDLPAQVTLADNRMILFEMPRLMARVPEDEAANNWAATKGLVIQNLSPPKARVEFMKRFNQLVLEGSDVVEG
jgi:5'-deoxynucleotidase YfbR-like HD superfamily hydrolase